MSDIYTYTSNDLKTFLSKCTKDELNSIVHDIYMCIIDNNRKLEIIMNKPICDNDNNRIIVFKIKLPITMFIEQEIIIDKLIDMGITKEQIFKFSPINYIKHQMVLDKIIIDLDELYTSSVNKLIEKYGMDIVKCIIDKKFFDINGGCIK